MDGGFSASHVPDQVSLNHTAGLKWRRGILSVGLQANLSDQDNRQPGREDADFVTGRNRLELGITPTPSLSLGMDLALESRDDKGAAVISDTRRWGIRASWSPLQSSSLSLNYSNTLQDDDADTFERDDHLVDIGWTSVVPFIDAFGGQYFLRFNRQSNRSLDLVRRNQTDRMNWTLNLGLSVSFGSI